MASLINTGGVGVTGVSIHDLFIQDLTADQAIDMFGGDGEICSCHISQTASIDTGIRVNGGPWRIHDNRVFTDDTGILLLSGTARCVVAHNVLGTGFKADGILIEGNDNIIIGNFADGGTIRITGDDNLIIGNTFRSLNSADNGFIIAGDRNFIDANRIVDDFGTAPAVGIEIQSGATDNIIGMNELSQATVEITDAGTGTIFLATGIGSPLTTKGDLHVYTTVDTRLPVGADDEILAADSAEASGVKWVDRTPVADEVAASETTASTTFADLTTAGPAVTLVTGTTVRVTVSVNISNATVGAFAVMGYAVSGASTLAADDAKAAVYQSPTANAEAQFSWSTIRTDITPGTNTFTAKYRATSGTMRAARRNIEVTPLPDA